MLDSTDFRGGKRQNYKVLNFTVLSIGISFSTMSFSNQVSVSIKSSLTCSYERTVITQIAQYVCGLKNCWMNKKISEFKFSCYQWFSLYRLYPNY